MAETTDNTRIPRGEWVDLNMASGIQIGTPLSVQNIGTLAIWYSVGPEPTEANTRFRILRRGEILTVDAGDPTVWLRSDVCAGAVNAQTLATGTQAEPSLVCEVKRIAAGLDLLNARFEEAFPTRILREDVQL